MANRIATRVRFADTINEDVLRVMSGATGPKRVRDIHTILVADMKHEVPIHAVHRAMATLREHGLVEPVPYGSVAEADAAIARIARHIDSADFGEKPMLGGVRYRLTRKGEVAGEAANFCTQLVRTKPSQGVLAMIKQFRLRFYRKAIPSEEPAAV
jgi:hypothetical protein